MLKRTLFFQSPGHLNLKDRQLCFSIKSDGGVSVKTVPIEDIGMLIIENPQITITTALLQALAANNTITILCDDKHMPTSFFSAMTANETAQRTVKAQLAATQALKDRLWKQTVQAKINNQAQVLDRRHKPEARALQRLMGDVRNGDPENAEGTAARFYFKSLAPFDGFLREPDGEMPNAALNYGYAIMRAAMARALMGSGLLCIAGIHHHNQYDPYCLADDIMEPYRAFVDEEVFNNPLFEGKSELSQEMKRSLLSLLAADVKIKGMKRPLQNAMSYTTASLARCFLKEQQIIDYPEFCQCPTDTQR